MTGNASHTDRRWQFSLRGLMFVTAVVCFWSALVHASLVLAIIVMPLLLAALVRTVRIAGSRQTEMRPRTWRHGLFGTFCTSLQLVAALIAVSGGVAAAGFLIIGLLLLGFAVRLCAPLGRFLWRVAMDVSRFSALLWKRVQPNLARVEPRAVIPWAIALAVAGTRRLVETAERLIKSWKSPTLTQP
ncbi:MAG: hypothetical protein WD669_08935 [Pirellulales bacterium]